MQGEYQPTRLGRMIRARRKKLHLTLSECGQKIGVSRQAIHQIEVGRNHGGNNQTIESLGEILNLDKEEVKAVRPQRKLCSKTRKTLWGNFWTEKRIEQHLTQEQLAAWTGLSLGLINENELGKTRPKRSTLWRLAWVLECEIPEKLMTTR